MKHTIVVLLCVLAVCGGLYTAVKVHRDYIHQETVQAVKTADMQAKRTHMEQQAVVREKAKTQDTIAQLEAGCHEGLAAYNNLTTYAKARMVKPVCPLE